jgi:chromosome segregation protein
VCPARDPLDLTALTPGTGALKLKKLELYGFKSFADHTTFEFEDGLSALVGPNGSGKSNVADGLKWVLGERSAQKLRGAEMTNVIFSGSESRKPLNFAEVRLTIDNSDGWLAVDYDEVSVCRRVDRSGQSEYSINGNVCRLKDVRGLLLDTGAGTTSYSFIEQGQVDQILRANPKERRKVFEEAAGISRFLEQRREAERKLERVSTNLARATDILDEVHRQLRSVKYQAARARTFKQQTERLEKLRLAHSLATHRRLQAGRHENALLLQADLARKHGLAGDLQETRDRVAAARARLAQAQETLNDRRTALAAAQGRLDGMAREAATRAQRKQELQAQLQDLCGRRSAVEERARAVEAELSDATRALELSRVDLARQDAELRQRREALRRLREQLRSHTHDIQQCKARVFSLFEEESRLSNELAVLDAERRTLEARLARIRTRRSTLDQQLAQTEQERSGTQQELMSLEHQQAEAADRVAAAREDLHEAQTALDGVAAAQSRLESELSGTVGRRDVLLDLEHRAEGVHSGVRDLLDAHPKGVVGLLAQLIHVPLGVAEAVDAALGVAAQAVVFDDAASARAALQVHAASGRGRAEILVRTSLPELDAPHTPAGADNLPSLSDLVSCEPCVRHVLHFLLGGTFLVPNADEAWQRLEAGAAPGVRFVSTDGQLWAADGRWAAGRPEAPGLISRHSELLHLETEVARQEQELRRLSHAREQRAARVRETQKQYEATATQFDALRHAAAELRTRLRVTEHGAEQARESLRLADAEHQAVRDDLDRAVDRMEQTHRQAQAASEARSRADSEVDRRTQSLTLVQEQEQQAAEEAASLGAELGSSRERLAGLESLARRLEQEGQHREQEIASLSAQQQATAERCTEAEQALAAAEAESASLRAQIGHLRDALPAYDEQLSDLNQQISAAEADCDALTAQVQDVDEQIQQRRLTEGEIAVKTQDLLDRTAEDYGVRLGSLEGDPDRWRDHPPFLTRQIREHTPDPSPARRVAQWYQQAQTPDQAEDEPEQIALADALEMRKSVLELADDPKTDWDVVRADIARLKSKVDRIGNVNVAAIRQQEELEIRMQFLTDQKEDLEKARRHEREIIRELNRKSRERFAETFQQVRANFQTLFRKLFGGGSADILIDPEEDDVLEAGIDILARPPGKEANSISLLSGGEKALTTVALLFAIFQRKPSPFCLLDEVDAPLDDNNVERFLMLLEEFRRNTQFIIITHNKVTMGVAQVLYGITMTDGVTRRIAVRLEDVDRCAPPDPLPRARAG